MIKTYKYLPFYKEIGTAEINGKTVKLCISAGGTPMIICGNKLFTMTWDELLERAEKEGIAE